MADEVNITEGDTAPAQVQTEEQKGEARYSDEDVNRILSAKFAKWQEAKDKEISEAKKLAEMNAQQKAEYERDQFQKELAEYKRKDARASMLAEARKAAPKGTPDEILVSLINAEDAEATKKAVDSFAAMFEEAVKAGVAEALKGHTPRAGSGATVTKADILAIKDRKERQRMISENLELFN